MTIGGNISSKQRDLVSKHLYVSARLARHVRRSIHLAAHHRLALRSGMHRNVLGLDQAARIHRHPEVIPSPKKHPLPLDFTRIRDPGFSGCLCCWTRVDKNVRPALAHKNVVPRDHRDHARRGAHRSAVGNRVTQKRHMPVGLDQALIDDTGREVETVRLRKEVRVRHMSGGRKKPPDVHDGAVAEVQTRGVHEVHVAVGQKGTEDLRGIAACHAVEHARSRVGLDKLDGFALPDVEAGIIDDGTVAGADGGYGAAAVKAGITTHHRLARRGGKTDFRTESNQQDRGGNSLGELAGLRRFKKHTKHSFEEIYQTMDACT